MVCLVYQRNDEIPTHIINTIPAHEAKLENALAKRRGRPPTARVTSQHTSKQGRSSSRRLALDSGLTVNNSKSFSTSGASSSTTTTTTTSTAAAVTNSITATISRQGVKKLKEAIDQEEDAALRDVFLPAIVHSNTQQQHSHPYQPRDQQNQSSLQSTSRSSSRKGPKTNEKQDEKVPEEGDEDLDGLNAQHAKGRQVFGFQSLKRSSGLKSILHQNKQSESTLPEKPSSHHIKATSKSGKRGRKKSDSASASDVDEEKEKQATLEKFSKRRRIAWTIARLNKAGSEDEDDGDDEEEEEEDGYDDASDESDQEVSTRVNENDLDQARDITEAAGEDPKKSFFEEDEMGAERYFQDLYQKSRTSNNTLSKLPTLEHADFVAALKRVPIKHGREMEMLTLLYEEQFPQWYFELISGFSLLIYGYGSKRQLLNKFATTVLTDAPLIIVNGYFPTLNLKDILDRISSTALQYSGPTGTLHEQIAFIHAYFQQPDREVKKLYLLVHNIDGSGLRSEKAQTALSLLASCPQIHMVASIDHINANIMWDTVKSARFRWCWHELTTYRSYMAETSFENSIMVRQGELGARGIQFVLASLTSNGRGLFKVLAEHQIQNERDPGAMGGSSGGASGGAKGQAESGMAYHALFKKCQENFLVSNAVTFRTQLTEFRDHRIVHSKKGPDGVEILYIPLPASVLEGILENMGS